MSWRPSGGVVFLLALYKIALTNNLSIFPKQRRHDWGGVLTSLLENYLCRPGFPVAARLPRLAYTCLDLPSPAANILYFRISRSRLLA
jgi:hypothetical protein